MKKAWLMMIIVFMAGGVWAHDEGHGPKLDDAGQMGGVVTAVIDAKDRDKGPKAKLLYKAELVRAKDGTVRVYLYDKHMEFLEISDMIDPNANALVETEYKHKFSEQPFELTWDGEEAFVGKSPRPKRKPFNIDVRFIMGKRTLLAAFDNLD